MRAPQAVLTIILTIALLAVPLAVHRPEGGIEVTVAAGGCPAAEASSGRHPHRALPRHFDPHLVTAFRQGLSDTGFCRGPERSGRVSLGR